MPEGDTPMRGSAAPTSPGAWDARSEALLGAPALTPRTGGALDPRTPEEPVDAPPSGIAPAPGEAAAGPQREGDTTTPPRPDADREPPTAPAADGTPRTTTRPGPPDATGPADPGPTGASAPRPRRGTADPVKVLMHRHRELCARAVDPLEIAAGLEAQGFTDRTAARFRHRDVFSLAEELYARVPRGSDTAAPPPPPPRDTDAWALAVLTPGAAAALTGIGLAVTHGPVRLAVGATGTLLLAAALFLAVRRGPFRAPDGGTVPAARLWTAWLLAYAVGGDGLLTQVLSGGPDGPWDLAPGPVLGLALAVAPAAWCARLFANRARRRIADSRGLADFAAGTRPLLLGTVTLQLLALTVLLGLTGFSSGALALGALLLFARLLTVHGFPETATAALAAAGAAEALALASVLAARVPVSGFDVLAAPVRAVVDAWGPGAVPTLVCGAAALGLLAHATTALARASAHATP
ncbi:hypothetical protein [Streptomyces sp. NBC_00572]|uniref:hypothetical protein n=1 Tax=Streptomyces sp. NBC_00572 TaxID=2903664 RepID=UPI00224F00DC|nr:hypothetical protein [Streptomyces sp. NBC_00572]MCX4983300.1 hypothetical protein [Streptomyces sp. NBC_00572]